jgi:hypothetical protein
MTDLIMRINEWIDRPGHRPERASVLANAVRDVLKLHQAVDVHNDWNPSGWCVECNDSGWEGAVDGHSPVPWPCQTVRRVAAALGVDQPEKD